MRLRGLVFERFGPFDRAEVDLCDESGSPLDVVLFVGETGAGKSALLRGVSGVLAEAVGAREELHADDVRRGEKNARCRVVFDDIVDTKRIVVTLERELPKPDPRQSALRASPTEAFEKWRSAIEREEAPRAAFSVASSHVDDPLPDDRSSSPLSRAPSKDDDDDEENGDHDPLLAWLYGLRGGPTWELAVRALDRVLWPCRFDHMPAEGDVVFSTPTGLASSEELGDAFDSVLVLALELLRLSTDRPNEELVYVIDDIDAHLHPRWQARILGDLRHAFPRVQLVATTHSPFVVASVEPHQVFRLERAPDKSATSLVRLSDRVPKGATISNIMDVAFGAPDLPGPRWVHSPPLAIRREVMQSLERDLPRGAIVSVMPDLTHVKDVKNAFGESALPLGEGVTGHIFFIDLEPGTAWGHSCEYVFRTREGKIVRNSGIWPPEGIDRFVPIGRT